MSASTDREAEEQFKAGAEVPGKKMRCRPAWGTLGTVGNPRGRVTRGLEDAVGPQSKWGRTQLRGSTEAAADN